MTRVDGPPSSLCTTLLLVVKLQDISLLIETRSVFGKIVTLGIRLGVRYNKEPIIFVQQ